MTHLSDPQPSPENQPGSASSQPAHSYLYCCVRGPNWLSKLQKIRDAAHCECELRSTQRSQGTFVIATSAPLPEKLQRRFGLEPLEN